MNDKEFELFGKRNLIRYVINKLCGVHRILEKEPSKLSYYTNLLLVLFQFSFLKRIVIPQIEFVITTNCNLKCRHCSNYIPTIEENNQFNLKAYDFQLYIKNLLINVYKLNSLILLGGEPLLNTQFHEILYLALINKKIEKVYIYTNGSLEFSENTIKLLKKYRKKAHIYLSNYTRNKELSGILKTDSIISQLKKNKISYTFDEKLYWVKQEPICCHNRSEEENSQIFNKCNIPAVSAVKGEMHVCPKAAAARVRGIVNFDKFDFIDMSKPVTKEEIISFYTQRYFSVCNNCSGPETPKVLTMPAEQIKNVEDLC